MRTFNVRLLGILLLCGAALTAGLFGLQRYQVRRQVNFYWRQAEDALGRGDNSEGGNDDSPLIDAQPGEVTEGEQKKIDAQQAMFYLTQFIRVASPERDEYPKALAELGLLQAQYGSARVALKTLNRALTMDQTRTDVRRRLVQILVAVGRYDDAEYHLSDARNPESLLKKSPDDPALWELLGVCQFRTGDAKAAANSLTKTIELAPNRQSAYVSLAEILRTNLGRADEADSWMDKLVQNALESDIHTLESDIRVRLLPGVINPIVLLVPPRYRLTPQAHVIRGDYRRRYGNLAGATQDAQAALQREPRDKSVLLLAAACAFANKEYDQVRIYAVRGTDEFPKEPLFYRTLADVAMAANDRDKAIEWLRRGMDEAPENAEMLWTQARLLTEAGRVDEAKQAIEQLQKLKYTPILVDFLNAYVLYQERDWRAAAAEFDRIRIGLANWRDIQRNVEFLLGTCSQQLGNPEMQEEAYRRAVNLDPTWMPPRLALASVMEARGRWSEALEEYRRVSQLKDAPASVWTDIARLEIRMSSSKGRVESDWESLQQTLDRADPSNPMVPILRAQLFWARQQRDEAVQVLRTAVRQEPKELQLWVALSELLQRQGISSQSAEARDLKFHEADQVLDQAEQSLGMGDLDISAQRVPLQLARAVILANRYLADVSADSTNKEQKQQKVVTELRKFAESTDAINESDKLALWRGLAGIAVSIGAYDYAEDLSLRVAHQDQQPQNLSNLLLLFDLVLKEKDETAADPNAGSTASEMTDAQRKAAKLQDARQRAAKLSEVLKLVESIEGRGAYWHFGQAARLKVLAMGGDQVDLSVALEHLANARLSRPKWSSIPALAADIHLLQGDNKGALESYKQAFDMGERRPQIVSQLVRLLYASNRYSEADQVLRTVETQERPFNIELYQLARNVSSQLKEWDRALLMAEQAVSRSEDYRDYMWYGELLALKARGDDVNPSERVKLLDRAEAALRKAVEMKGDVRDAWYAWILFLTRSRGEEMEGDVVQAAIAEARQKLPAADDVTFVLANVNEALNRSKEAEGLYRQLLEQSPRNSEIVRRSIGNFLRNNKIDDAVQLLEQMIAETSEESSFAEADKAWARRNLASILARQGGGRNLERAKELIDENLKAAQPSRADRRAKVVVLAASPNAPDRADAIRILANIVNSEPEPSPDDRFNLARLYLAAGDWTGFNQQMRTLVTSYGKTRSGLPYLATYINALLDRDNVSEAEYWMNELEKIAPGEFGTVQLRASILLAKSRYDESLKTLQDFKPPADATQEQILSYSRLESARLENFAQRLSREMAKSENADMKEAIGQQKERFLLESKTLLSEWAAQSPDRKFVLAAFLARNERFDESLDVMEKSWQTAKLQDIVATGATFTRSAGLTDEQFHRLERILKAAADKNGWTVPLLTLLGDMYSWRQQYGQAESLYRQILDQDKDQTRFDVRNNLSLLLALQGQRKQESLDLINEAIKIAGENSTLLDSRAMIYLAWKDPNAALRDLNQAIRYEPSGTHYFHLAQAYQELGRPQDAKQAMDQARKLGLTIQQLHPLEYPAYEQLAKVLE